MKGFVQYCYRRRLILRSHSWDGQHTWERGRRACSLYIFCQPNSMILACRQTLDVQRSALETSFCLWLLFCFGFCYFFLFVVQPTFRFDGIFQLCTMCEVLTERQRERNVGERTKKDVSGSDWRFQFKAGDQDENLRSSYLTTRRRRFGFTCSSQFTVSQFSSSRKKQWWITDIAWIVHAIVVWCWIKVGTRKYLN